MSRLSVLTESLREAQADLTKLIDECDQTLETRSLSPDETQRLEQAQDHVATVKLAYAEAKADHDRAMAEQEERASKLGGVEVDSGVVRVGGEPLTYSGANPDNSYVRDLFAAVNPGLRGSEEARQRLIQHQTEMDGLVRSNPRSKEGRALIRYARTADRERRDVSTGTSSMGDMAPPLYFLPDYAPWRTYGRTLIDALRPMSMPETGMVFNIPKITAPTEAVNQTNSTTQGTNENTTVTVRTLTSTYQSGTVQTIIDNLLVSQQYLDRVGPGIGGDQIVRDDMSRQVNRSLNVYAWKKLLGTPTAGSVSYTESAFTGATFRQAVIKAKRNIEATDSVVAYPTHIFSDVTVWGTLEGSYDANDRPFVVSDGVAFNPIATGADTATPEGFTGYKLADLPYFKDQANYVAWQTLKTGSTPDDTYHPTVVAALDIASCWMEGAPVLRVLPQPYAKSLTVLIQEYVYCAYISVYPKAIQVITGTGTDTAHLTA